MDARQTKPIQRSRAARLVFVVLVLILVLGLWQGYGEWLVGGGAAHAA